MNTKSKYFMATSTAIIFWSASFIATKISYTIFAPMMVGLIRFFIASVILGAMRILKKDEIHPTHDDMKKFVISGLLGITLYFAAENIGVQLTTASNASLIVASYPAITSLFEFLIYGTKPKGKTVIGIVLAFIGICILTVKQDSANNVQSLYGNIILIVAGIIWAFYNFTARSVAEKYSPLTISYYQMLFGTIFFLPLVLLEHGTIQAITFPGTIAIVYLSCGCSVAAFLLYNLGLRRLSAATSISLMNLVPVFGLLFSVLLLHETTTLRQIIGGIIVITGVVLSTHNTKNTERGN